MKIKTLLLSTTIALSVPSYAASPADCQYVSAAAMNAMIWRHRYENVEDAIAKAESMYGESQLVSKLLKNAYEYDPVFKSQPLYEKISKTVLAFARDQYEKECEKTSLNNG